MSKLGLEPSRVFHYFEELSAIPHGSGNTKQISDYCVEYAKKFGFEYYQDDANNVIIIKEASAGREADKPVIIQGHLDMVCEKEEGCSKDMNTEGLDLFVEGDLLKAKGTTLGGDDGIAVAMSLALLEDEKLSHPRLEAVFTVDEEIGMLGAAVLDPKPLKGKVMLNIDSEQEGIFTVSCAGGVVAKCKVPYEREVADGNTYEISIHGLTGGHSGIEIHKGRASANKMMFEILDKLMAKCDFRLVSISGGLKDNAIPVMCKAVIMSETSISDITDMVNDIAAPLLNMHAETDPRMKLEVVETSGSKEPMTAESTKTVIKTIYSLPEGVQKMSEDVDGLVQTSLNMGILETNDTVDMSYCVRSSVDAEKQELLNKMNGIISEAGGKIELSGDYPGWQYRKESPLRDLMISIYEEQYGKTPVIEAIHAGVECGLFAGMIDDLDCVSYGPDLCEIHTFRETMSISSVQRVYKFTKEIIERGM